MKNMVKSKKLKKTKLVKLSMKFNPGLEKYEPVLPTRKTGKDVKLDLDWKWLVIPIIVLIILMLIFLFVLKDYL